MFDRAFAAWLSWPLWARWVSAIGVIIALDAGRMAWPERDFVGGFLESFAAILFRYGAPILAIACGWWVGSRAAERTESNWFGWVSGIATALVAATILFAAADAMPGVKWRLDAMTSDDCHTDWDGRANPVVCD